MTWRLLVLMMVLLGDSAQAGPPEPLYPIHIQRIEKESPGAIVAYTSDSADTVAAWYRKTIKDGTGEHKDSEGYIFYTKTATTVVISPGFRFDPLTKVGLEWDNKKYGPYEAK